MYKLALTLFVLLLASSAHAQGVKFKQGTTRPITSGTTDTAKNSDYWGYIAWRSATVGTKNQTFPPCTGALNGVEIGVGDQQGTAAANNIVIVASAGKVGNSLTGVSLTSNFGSALFVCDGINTNWIVRASYLTVVINGGSGTNNALGTGDTTATNCLGTGSGSANNCLGTGM